MVLFTLYGEQFMQTISTSPNTQTQHHSTLTPITVALGDGIGPEITQATLRILEAAGAKIAPEFIDIGQQTYLAGHSSGMTNTAWQSLRRTKVFLKGPITTPSGGGFKSLNVTIRKTLGLYANVRQCVSYAPFVTTLHPQMDLVIIRENEEDLYAGIEHRQTDEVYQCLKLITRSGCERIVRYAFEYARVNNRKKVTCMVKDNIMKMTDGLFYKVFQEIGAEYPEIKQDRYIIDIGSARLATRPEHFDVIVTLNLYGDILSDIAAEISGSVGLAGSANIGDQVAMFEAIHGSAPDIAGQGIANPSGLLLSAVMMLTHIGQPEIAEKIHNAWLSTIEDGICTADLCSENTRQQVTSTQFTDAVIARLGKLPQVLAAVHYQNTVTKTDAKPIQAILKPASQKVMVGVDVFVHDRNSSPEQLATHLQTYCTNELRLQMITNRGVKVWPDGFSETFCTDHWRCRFMAAVPERVINHQQIIALLSQLTDQNVDVIKTENLCTFDGECGFSLGQGQ